MCRSNQCRACLSATHRPNRNLALGLATLAKTNTGSQEWESPSRWRSNVSVQFPADSIGIVKMSRDVVQHAHDSCEKGRWGVHDLGRSSLRPSLD